MREVAERKPIKKTEPKKEAVRETIGTGKEEKKAEKTGKGIPAYLVVLLVVLAVVGSYAVFLLLDSDSPPNGSNGNGGKEGIVRVKLLYSNECVFCRNHNTILDVFDAKGIPFEVGSCPEIFPFSTDFGTNGGLFLKSMIAIICTF